MFQPDSEETPIAFHDVAAYFSEEDWKRLHQWQKELYTNVMKEIHEALISLGYQIINSEVLLRINKGEESYTQDIEDSERRGLVDDATSCYPIVQPDVLLRIKPGEGLCLRPGCDLEEAEIANNCSIGLVSTSLYSMSPKGGGQMCSVDQEETPRIYSNHGLSIQQVQVLADPPIVTSVMPFAIKEEAAIHSLDYQYSERRENISSSTGTVMLSQKSTQRYLTSHNKTIPRIITRQASPIPARSLPARQTPSSQRWGKPRRFLAQETAQQKHHTNTAGNGTMNMNRNNGEAVKYVEKTTPCKVLLENIKVETLQSSGKRINSRTRVCSQSNRELGGEKTTRSEGGLNHSDHSIQYLRMPKVEESDTCNQYPTDLRDETLVTGQQTPQQRLRPYRCNVCGLRFSRKVHLITHRITHRGETREAPYQCTECETSFSQKILLITHQRTHMGARKYKCSDCEKSYTSNTHLQRHRKTHTGDRPFQCTECGKRYLEKGTLKRHFATHIFSLNKDATKRQRKQTGERLDKCEKNLGKKKGHFQHKKTHTEKRHYQCTECDKHCDTKQQLSRHMTSHMEERPFQCAECLQRFTQRVILIRHQRTHTGEKPFQCSECEKSYTQKQHLTRHQRTHLVQEESLDAIVLTREPKGRETVRWTIDGRNELVSVPTNAGSTIS